MREIIGKLARGIYEYELPVIMSSVSIIEETIETGIIYNGSFELYSENEEELKGIVYSTNDKFIIINNQFIGKRNKINFKVLTEFTEIRDNVSGNINIVSNGGEIVIPFKINIEPAGIKTTSGIIKTLDEFVELVINSYDEALKIFESNNFEKCFLMETPKYNSVYKGLIRGTDKKIALEEFLVFIGKKNKVSLSLSEYGRNYENLDDSYGDSFILKKEHWGYVEIETQVKGDFIKVANYNIDSDMFAGNSYEFVYFINYNKLFNGLNIGEIIFKTHNQTVKFDIVVDNKKEEKTSINKKELYFYKLYRNYLEFKLNKISVEKWANNSLEILEKELFEDSQKQLIKAWIFLLSDNKNTASEILEDVAADVIQEKANNVEDYCFFMFLRAIEKKDNAYTHETILKIKDYYENGYDSDMLLLMMLYLNEDYENNQSLIFARLKERFMNGNRSPFIYFEALKILNELPELLRVLNSFELQVLNFGAKNRIINEELALRLSELALEQKDCKPILFRLLNYLFDIYMNNVALEAICTLLIREEKTEQKYFKWYEAGVKANLKITKLFEYYMLSVSTDYMGELPRSVLLYFLYNASVLAEKQSFLYFNIVINKEQHPNIYRSYIKRIEKYAVENLAQGNIDEFLSVIYKKVLNESLMNTEIIKKLPEVIHTYKIECDNENVRKVIVCHKELNEEFEVKIINNEAYIKIFSSDVVIIFEDFFGRRYVESVDYRLDKLFYDEEFVKFCIEYSPYNKYMLMAYTKNVLKHIKDHHKILRILKSGIDEDDYRLYFAKAIMQDTVEYYYENYDNEIIDEYLVLFNKSKMNSFTRKKVIELMIIRGMYDEAFSLFLKYGNENVDPGKIVKFCTRSFDKNGMEFDPIYLDLCAYAYRNGKYNELVLKYLSMHYYGLTKEMINLWESSIGFEYENRELEERLVVQILFAKTYLNYLVNIYDSYQEKGANSEVKRAYLFFKSCEYYLHDSVTDEKFFNHLESQIGEMQKMEEMCKIAFLKHISGKEILTNNQENKCKDIILELSNKKIRLPFFGIFSKWFDLPYSLRDKYIVEYKSNPSNKVYISYVLETGKLDEKKYEKELMTQICQGIFVKEFIIFYGESIQYYIVETDSFEDVLTESVNFKYLDEFENDESRYGSLNNMMLSLEMNDEKTFNIIAENYNLNLELVDRLFTK